MNYNKDFNTDAVERCSRSLIQLTSSLGNARHRRKESAFKAEGTKCVFDTIGYFSSRFIVATVAWLKEFGTDLTAIRSDLRFVKATASELERMTDFRTAPQVIAVYDLPDRPEVPDNFGNTLSLAVDGVQDPGNLGTILRTCDWFGIHDILCSQSTVDIFNPKTVQATMGAISRMRVYYVDDLALELSECIKRNATPVYGTFLNGVNLFGLTPDSCDKGIIVVGNEGQGISDAVGKIVTQRVTIPSFSGGETAISESLNVGIAAAITIAHFRSVCHN